LRSFLQAQRADLDIRHANEQLDREETMRTASRRWDAGATERARALSLHASESGRHTLEGRNRVAAAEASVAFDKQESTWATPFRWHLSKKK
jgi:hypothetical protein